MVTDGARSAATESQSQTVSHSGGRQPWEKPQMMEVEEKEGMAAVARASRSLKRSDPSSMVSLICFRFALYRTEGLVCFVDDTPRT